MAETPKQTVLVVDDHESIRKQLFWALEEDYIVLQAASRQEAMSILERENVHIILCDLRMPPVESDITEGMEIVKIVHRLNPRLPVIVITGENDSKTDLEVHRHGAYDLFHKPFDVEEVKIIVGRAAKYYELVEENIDLRDQLRRQRESEDQVVGKNPALQRILDQAKTISETNATVLITGESGTGKEMLARYIHNISPNRRGPFIACNIAALPETLVESELFGHEKGAFTGANTRREGRFELANNGTLFLDEIGELTPAMQVKLLRVLQERQFERLGGKQMITVDIRVITATNRNLEEMVDNGQFRADLYYRLNIVNLELPPLRGRQDDIEILAKHFINKAAIKYGKTVPGTTKGFEEKLRQYRWPGNIRELENVMERAVVINNGPELDVDSLPEKILTQTQLTTQTPTPTAVPQLELINGALPPDLSFESAITDFKRQLVRQALRECHSSRSEAAQRLKISRQYLHRLINELHVEE